ncbi:PepSY-associated TM helix domain-containing protein [Bacillus sp. JJ1764]|uniref:PepSY-associated TM helix domain-containing protein n=1 Tax=Bacillus sp. JJ1764 TaxID=3122964 RepID=UPI002FFF6937
MKKTRNAHLWIGLICSIFILMESITGLIMNEPWLIGQSQTEQKGNFPTGQMMPPGQQGTTNSSSQSGQTNGQSSASANGTTNSNTQANANSQDGTNTNGQFPAMGGRMGQGGTNGQSQSLMGIIRGLHEGRIGNTDVTWLIDLVAVALIFLTGTGIYLSVKILAAEKKRKKLKTQVA